MRVLNEKDMPFYEQHSLVTCGPSCALMIFYLYNRKNYPSKTKEWILYDNYHSEVFMGVTGAAMADCLSARGLKVELLHSAETYMDNREGYFPQDLFEDFLAEYRHRLSLCADRVSV